MITHRNKQIKKQLPTLLHLHLHRPTPLKRRPTPDNQRQVMRPELRLGIRRVSVGIPRARKDRAALDTRVQALFAKREAFEGLQGVFFCCAAVSR